MSKDFNCVSFNLPGMPHGAVPNKDAPLVSIDGVLIEQLISIKIEAGVDRVTRCSIEFYAKIDGEAFAQVEQKEVQP